MSVILDVKYLTQLATQLDQFRQRKSSLWNFRCPICHDSKKDKTKTRAYVIESQDHDGLHFYCHNCNASMRFPTFLQQVDSNLYDQYLMDYISENPEKRVFKTSYTPEHDAPLFRPIEKTGPSEIPLSKVSELSDYHEAVKYIQSRKIPKESWNEMYFSPNFKTFCESYIAENNNEKLPSWPCIIIPFKNEYGNVIGFQARSLLKSGNRYISMKLDSHNRKIFGLDRIDRTREICVLEGIFDSFFVPNSLATLDSNLLRARHYLPTVELTFIYDNQPRNLEILTCMEKCIQQKERIVIWPSHITSKDCNDMIKSGELNIPDLVSLIKTRTFQGIEAEMEYNLWRKM